MEKAEFSRFRKCLQKTQREMAELLGTSIKAVHSYEQGWRTIPVHVERQVYFLLSRGNPGGDGDGTPCWEINYCPEERRSSCPAWEFRTGNLCWFINGTICGGKPLKNWKEKIEICKSCKVLSHVIPEGEI